MGTCYYFVRPDNATVFDMDKAYGLREILGKTSREPVAIDDIAAAIPLWYAQWPNRAGDVDLHEELVIAIDLFSGGKPIYFCSEHDSWLDELFYDKGVGMKVAGDRFKVCRKDGR